MAIIKGAVSGAKLEIGAATLAARMELRPTDVGTLGSYALTATSGAMAAGLGAAAPIFSCRWGDATRSMLLRRVGIMARATATAFTAGNTLFELMVARSFTAADTAGTSVLPTGSSQKRRTSFGTTLISDLRISSTATLTAGTRTLDAAAHQLLRGGVPATQVNYPMVGKGIGTFVPGASTVAFSMDWQDIWSMDIANEWPMVFVVNEGFILRATVPATGTWDFSVLMEWSEVVSTAGFN